MYSDFCRHQRPRAVFSIKDFQRLENAIIQTANINNIPTFCTPHSVAHFFVDKNERNGNLVLYNVTATNVLAWGEFNNEIYKEILGLIGLAYLAQQTAIGLYKAILPFLGMMFVVSTKLFNSAGSLATNYMSLKVLKPSIERVRCYRLKFYYDLVNKKPEQERFLFGWFKRAISI